MRIQFGIYNFYSTRIKGARKKCKTYIFVYNTLQRKNLVKYSLKTLDSFLNKTLSKKKAAAMICEMKIFTLRGISERRITFENTFQATSFSQLANIFTFLVLRVLLNFKINITVSIEKYSKNTRKLHLCATNNF